MGAGSTATPPSRAALRRVRSVGGAEDPSERARGSIGVQLGPAARPQARASSSNLDYPQGMSIRPVTPAPLVCPTVEQWRAMTPEARERFLVQANEALTEPPDAMSEGRPH